MVADSERSHPTIINAICLEQDVVVQTKDPSHVTALHVVKLIDVVGAVMHGLN
jgi:hypothetical protein